MQIDVSFTISVYTYIWTDRPDRNCVSNLLRQLTHCEDMTKISNSMKIDGSLEERKKLILKFKK